MPTPSTVEELWTVAPVGNMPPLEQMKAFALREVLQSADVKIANCKEGPVNYQWIAERVKVYTEDQRVVRHPSRVAIKLFFEKVDADEGWYPGKTYHTKKRGPQPLLNKAKRRAIASSMMAAKKSGVAPS